MPQPPQIVPVTCALCKRQFAAQTQSIIDVGQDPKLKARLISGRINLATCPQCGHTGMLNAPFLYHDPEKEMLLCFLPTELGLKGTDQQKFIGDLTNTLMDSLPPEKRKAYFLQPKIFFSLESLIKEIMRADGITEEMLEAQKAKAELIEELLNCSDDEQLKKLVKERKDRLDYEFFQFLTASMEASRENGQGELAERLWKLRSKLLKLTTVAKAAPAPRIAPEAAQGMTKDELLQKMIDCQEDKELEALVAIGRPLIDYGFFQDLTGRIEAAQVRGESKEVQRLTELRSKILDISARQDEEVKAALGKAADLLGRIMRSDDPEKMIGEHLSEIDQAFFIVLTANIQGAEAGKRTDLVERLRNVRDLTVKLLQESAPPEIKLVNQLLEAEYPDETRKLLEENAHLVNDELVKIMNFIAEDLRNSGRTKDAQRLRKIRQQAAAISK